MQANDSTETGFNSEAVESLIDTVKSIESIKAEVEDAINASKSIGGAETNGIGPVTTIVVVSSDCKAPISSGFEEEDVSQEVSNEITMGADAITKAVSFDAKAINDAPTHEEIEKTKSSDSSQVVFTYSINTADEVSIVSNSSGASCDDDSLNEKLGIDSSNNTGEKKVSSPGGAIPPPSALTMTPPKQQKILADVSGQLFSPDRSIDETLPVSPVHIPTSPLAAASPGTKKKKLERLDWRLP